MEYIAPKCIDDLAGYLEVNKGVKKIEEIKYYGGSDKSKRVCVSNNIYFGQIQLTGVNNPFQVMYFFTSNTSHDRKV